MGMKRMVKREWEYLWMNIGDWKFLDSLCSDIRYFRNAFSFFYRSLEKNMVQILITNYI